MPEITSELLAGLAEESGFSIAERSSIPHREASYEPIPSGLDSRLKNLVQARYPKGLYAHQSQAISSALAGEDVCLATSTASGKSLVFMVAALNKLLADPGSTVIALYPVKALIQDQLEKWEEILKPFGIQHRFIDGGVPVLSRNQIISKARVLLMTPDVAHAWMMSSVSEGPVKRFLDSIRLVILDEAHVYDGVFGTNMAYFIRRFQSMTNRTQFICSTATIGEPKNLMNILTGRTMRVFDESDDTSARPEKTLLLCRSVGGDTFDKTVQLLVQLAELGEGRFLAFGDSRRMVERMVAAALRKRDDSGIDPEIGEEEDGDDKEEEITDLGPPEIMSRILPYRAGYEVEDRKEIQNSLSHGGLSGVVSTSALELGLDIGEIRIVVLMSTPPSVKSFYQRLGRAGRTHPAVCLILDDQGAITSLNEYCRRKMEPSWLYLDNRYIQYANALCAAREHGSIGRSSPLPGVFDNLPADFVRLLLNELDPTEDVPSDLYPLKQRAAAGSPHHEFPIRSQMEQEFKVTDYPGRPFGNLSFPQALREAYPGAIYYYMARPLRVKRFNYRTGEIKVVRSKYWTTKPLAQSMVFPKFPGGILCLAKSDKGFLAEAELQVSERVLGFDEMRGRNKTRYEYGPNSDFCRAPITRFFLTTGVCWYFPEPTLVSEPMASALREAFCILCGVQERELGVGVFHSRQNPIGLQQCKGICVYDSTNGSLRLTQQLASRFVEVIDKACDLQLEYQNTAFDRNLMLLKRNILSLAVAEPSGSAVISGEGDWVVTIAPGEKAMYRSEDGYNEVTVIGTRFTPRGLMIELEPQRDRANGMSWMVAAKCIEPINGVSRQIRLNLMTGQTESISEVVTVSTATSGGT